MAAKKIIITKQLAEVEKGLHNKDAIKGSLKVSKKASKKGDLYYYAIQYVDRSDNKYYCRYIRRNELNIARKMAICDYYDKIRKRLIMQLDAVNILLSSNSDDVIDDCYTKMAEGRKHLVCPLVGTAQQKINAWNDEKYEQNTMYPENLLHETERGELVRSKSEEMIANYLYSLRDYIDYKYERPLSVKVNGKEEIIYPDFTIINLRTGEMYILEHVSRLDIPGYHDKFVWKHNAYLENGFVQKGMILYSFESEGQPFTLKHVKKLVQDIIIK